ncbi:hypothetical protein GXW83_21920 [Streptacidiphilus sp. PB12-B1b]|uniref:hypothetical protein n=1 Tax=Streptacidiphilus sp. PB12-B1b TaxID=2705012 RepID=UPI0015FD3295|nr:hypothetical protein [Streptacidiphilus sp. PB12-B1b]QMU77958.1 hypothetical protein GXW83_21920 [Streptacidiphilus sp. PB12-B1b]
MLRAPFQLTTWRHLLFAALGPLGFAALEGTQFALRPGPGGQNSHNGLLLIVVVVAVALIGPGYERLRARLVLGEEIGRRRGRGRIGRGALFFLFNLVLTGVMFLLVAGWVIVSIRNLSYPIWGWAPYPDPAWGGPTAFGAVLLHFSAGVLAFFLVPWAVVRINHWQLGVDRKLIGARADEIPS